VTEQFLGQVMGQGRTGEESGGSNSQDVNLDDLAELIFKKLLEELLLENDRTGRMITGR
jgi:hypothetical protein